VKCENCGIEKQEIAGRFCTIKCARSFSTKATREERNRKISLALANRKLIDSVPLEKKFSCSFCQKSYVKKSSLAGHEPHCGQNPLRILKERKWERDREEFLALEFDMVPERLKREKIFREQRGSCNRCGLKEWLGQKITLEIEHKNGDHYDNSRENLELLCPNCHSLLDNGEYSYILKVKDNQEKTTLGDISALSDLKDKLDAKK
jgi:hypothetical protein